MTAAIDDRVIEREITEALLAYFRPGVSIQASWDEDNQNFPATPRLLMLHWAFGSLVVRLLRRVVERQGEISSSSASVLDEGTGRLRGQVVWPATVIRRRATGSPAVSVFRDVRRTYDLPANRVVRYVVGRALQSLQPYAGDPSIESSQYGQAIRKGFALGVRARRILALRELDLNTSSAPSHIDLLQATRSKQGLHRIAADAYQMLLEIQRGRSETIQEILSETLVAPLEMWRRFELFVVIRLAVALSQRLGAPPTLENLTSISGGPAIKLGAIELYWGLRPSELYEARPLSKNEKRSAEILRRYGLPMGVGRPDVLVADSQAQSVLAVIECKYVSQYSEPDSQFREAIQQLVEYSQDYGLEKAKQRLSQSAAVMTRLPPRLEGSSETGDPNDPIVMSGGDLLGSSRPMELWLNRLLPA